MKNLRLVFILVLFQGFVMAQYKPETDPFDPDNIKVDSLEIENKVQVAKFKFHRLPKFQENIDKKYYHWLKKKVFNAYPVYVKMIGEYESLQVGLDSLEKNRYKKKLIRQRQRAVADDYLKIIKDMTRSEGRVLNDLLYRKTGKTSFDLIKELKGGLYAGSMATIGKQFDVDLKDTYNPKQDRRDAFIENILLRAFSRGDLIDLVEEQPTDNKVLLENNK